MRKKQAEKLIEIKSIPYGYFAFFLRKKEVAAKKYGGKKNVVRKYRFFCARQGAILLLYTSRCCLKAVLQGLGGAIGSKNNGFL